MTWMVVRSFRIIGKQNFIRLAWFMIIIGEPVAVVIGRIGYFLN
jgi:hypothetical protein